MDAAVVEPKDARGVVTLTMNRPASLGALSEEMLTAFTEKRGPSWNP